MSEVGEFKSFERSTNEGFGAGSLRLPVISSRHLDGTDVAEDGGIVGE